MQGLGSWVMGDCSWARRGEGLAVTTRVGRSGSSCSAPAGLLTTAVPPDVSPKSFVWKKGYIGFVGKRGHRDERSRRGKLEKHDPRSEAK